MYNIWKKIFLVGILGTVSAPVLAQEYDNYYVEYMYENYVGKRRARPVEFDIMEQNLQTNKGINLPTVDDNYLNAKNYDDKFYIQLNLGLNKFEKYNASFEEAPNNKADLKSDKNEMSYGGAIGWAFDRWNVELEAQKVDFDKIETDDINKTTLIEYNQKIKTLSGGVNFTYNLLSARENKIVPFLGMGLGYSQFKIADFGYVWAKDGIPVEAGTEGAEKTAFESGFEKKGTPYAKAQAGFSIMTSEDLSILMSLEYRLYKDIKTDNNLKLENMKSWTGNVGLRFNF